MDRSTLVFQAANSVFLHQLGLKSNRNSTFFFCIHIPHPLLPVAMADVEMLVQEVQKKAYEDNQRQVRIGGMVLGQGTFGQG